MLGLLTDIPNARGIIVTTIGFQTGVQRFCEHYGIALKRIRPPKDSDWDGFIQNINVDLVMQRNHYSLKSLDIRNEGAESRSFPAPVEEIEIEDARYTGKRSLVQWLDFSVHSKAGVNVLEEIELKPESANVIFKGEQIGKIESVVLENVSRVTNKRINIDAKEIVAAVLEDTATGAIEHTKLKPASS